MTDFKNIKTRYVRNKLKGLGYNKDNALYIRDLMFIERVISGERINYIAGMVYESKKRKYVDEFRDIYSEIDPEGYKQYLENEEKRKKYLDESRKQLMIKEELEEKLSRESWKEVSENSSYA